MKKRSPIAVVALTLVTFTVYAYYWLYKTTDELKEEAGRDDLHPLVDVVLAVLTFGLWGLWAAYRNARIAHEVFEDLGEPHADRSIAVAIFGAFSLVSGWAWLVSMAILQDDYNRLADELEHFGETLRHEPARARVEVEPAVASAEQENAPPVFRSKAPAPIVL